MKKTLFVHIGTSKTGTTAIQYFCHYNKDILHRYGFDYPQFPFIFAGGIHRNGMFLTNYCLDENGERLIEKEEEIFARGLSLIAAAFEQYDRVILSDEGIWWGFQFRRPDVWERLLKLGEEVGFELKVIVYFRRQDQYVESGWNQRVKHNYTPNNHMTWEEYLEKYEKIIYVDYEKGLEKLEKWVGRDQIIVRRFQKESFTGNSLLWDFFSVIGLHPSDEEMENADIKDSINDRLHGNMAEIKRLINEVKGYSRGENILLENIAKMASPISGEKYPCQMFSPEEARQFMEQYQEMNDRVAERYIGDGQPLFSDDVKDLPKWEKENPYLTDDIIRFTGCGFLYLSRELQKQKGMNEELKKQLNVQNEELKKQKQTIDHLAARMKGFEQKQERRWERLKHPFRTLLKKMRKKITGKQGSIRIQ